MRRILACLILSIALAFPAAAQGEEYASRGWFVEQLWQWAGSVPFAVCDIFSDVDRNSDWAEPVAWAENMKLIQGDGQGHFFPDVLLTYAQLELILSRYDAYLDRPGGTYCPNAQADAPVTISDARKVIEIFYRDGAYVPSLYFCQK